MEVKIPLVSADVTKDWLQSALLSNNAKQVMVHELGSCSNDGGVLSSILKAKVTIDGQEHKLFIKIMPPSHLPQKVFIENFALDAIEVKTYGSVFKQLEQFEVEHLGNSNIRSIGCKFYAGDCCQDKDNRGFYIILEDIGESFKMPDFDHGLSDEQIKNSLKHLAYFHSLSYCYGQLNKIDFLEEFPMPYHKFLEDSEAQTFIGSLFQRAQKELQTRNETKLSDILEKLSKNFVEKFKHCYGGRDGRFLVHGDVWSNNTMFNDQNECILVDWQFTSASTPYLDIAAMAFMNQDPAKTQANLNTFLSTYFTEFELVCSRLKIQGPWSSYEDFKEMAIEEGFPSLFVWLLVSFSPCVYSPNIMDRFVYIFNRALDLSPTLFE